MNRFGTLPTVLAAAITIPALAQAPLIQNFGTIEPAPATVLEWRALEHANGETGGGEFVAPYDDLSPIMRQRIMNELADTRSTLEARGRLRNRDSPPVTGPADLISGFGWPLRQAAGRTDFSFYSITNFIDEDSSYPNHLLDYNCGARTYDLASGYNHQGTDIALWPFAWKKMDNSDVEIVAGAAGTIIGKSDGNFDRSCGFNNNQWNAVYVQHADGSVAWYGHMKSGSPTSKAIGATVAAGEYLGVVGSSGSSTGPHLHLELYDAGDNLVDPWIGSCNSKSKLVSWAQQPAYYDPTINAITVGSAAPNFPACPASETSYETGFVAPGGLGYFTVYARDQRNTDVISVRWYKPDGSLWQSSSSGVPSTFYAASYWWWSRTLPTTPTGTWRFEATMAGNTSVRTFAVGASPIDGVCGSSNGGTFSTAPIVNLCSSGTATAVSGSGPWSWSCIGSNGGATASCSATSNTPAVADCLFNWAERAYPNLFAPAGAASINVAPWYYRYYSQTDAYLGTSSADNHVYYRSPATNNSIVDEGALTTWLPAAGCQ